MADDRIWDIVLKRLDDIAQSLEQIRREGCSKAGEHAIVRGQADTLFERVRELEREINVTKGKFVVGVAIIGIIVTFGLEWLGRRM